MRLHLYKRDEAVPYARSAAKHLLSALREIDTAQKLLEASGYKGAARGVRQAGFRVKSWQGKVEDEISFVTGVAAGGAQ
jgi:hypothetical protein